MGVNKNTNSKMIAFAKVFGGGGSVTPDPQEIADAVDAYLDAHPEATTTVQDGSITKQKMASDMTTLLSGLQNESYVQDNVSYTPTNNKYIDRSGNIQGNGSFSYTSPIAVFAGDYVEVYAKGYSTNVCMIGTCNSTGGNIVPKVVSTDSTLKSYYYEVDADGYIISSYNTSSGCKVTIHKKASNRQLGERMNAVEANALIVSALETDSYINVIAEGTAATMSTSGKFIHNNGQVMTSGGFSISASISIPANSTFKFNAKGYTDQVAVLAKVNSDNTYTPLINSTDSNEHVWTISVLEAINVVISSNDNVTPKYSIYSSKIDENSHQIANIKKSRVAFATMGVIGDSIASGASTEESSGYTVDRPAYSWGKYIQREHGIEVTLFAKGGFTTRDWLSNSDGLTKMQNADPLDCYIIGLGVNDKYLYGTEYLGTSDDVNVGNESENADTYYGNYSKIIAAIKAKSPRAKIFCLTNPRASIQTATGFNDAVEDIVELYADHDVYLVDIASDPYYLSTECLETWNGSHSTAAGYKVIAENIYDHINSVITQNIADFVDIQWIIDPAE